MFIFLINKVVGKGKSPFTFITPLSLLAFIFLIISSGCKGDEKDSSAGSGATCKTGDPSEDTRAMVQEAIKKIDPMTALYSHTEERIKLISDMINKESDPAKRLNLVMNYGSELLKIGDYKNAVNSFLSVLDFIEKNNVEISHQDKHRLLSNIAISYLRQGEIENCLQFHNHASCFLPVRTEGVHKLTEGSSKAIEWYAKILEVYVDDHESKYLMNLAYMTLGQYPDKVPSKYLVPEKFFKNKIKFPQFNEVAGMMGLNNFSLSGGTIVDDFTNDGWLDIITTSYSIKEELVFYVNNGDGSFSDKTKEYNLNGQFGILNLNHTDINNDGWLDILLLRGGWYGKNGEIPKTLLLNSGKGYFEDITIKAGLSKVAPSQTASWTDFNLDGWLDLAIANETSADKMYGVDIYLNKKDNTFEHISDKSGVSINGYFKAIISFDADNDKYSDFYLSSINSENILFRNVSTSDIKFTIPAESKTMAEPLRSFPAFAFDYNNDGFEDLFVSAYDLQDSPSNAFMKDNMGLRDNTFRPRLYENNGNLKFTEKSAALGLNEAAFTMGCNFGDINLDGYLDFYLGTGNPIYQSLVPNKMYLNVDGKKFEDVSYVGGFSNIQKGHGVGFGDLDHDGDEDIYITIGGAYEGDGYFNCLFENPNHEKNNWLVLKLQGTSANKAAIGSKVKITIEENGKERTLYRVVSSGSSFGGNSLVLELGLRKATKVKSVEVIWPCKDCPDEIFTGMEVNKAYLIVQGQATPSPIEYSAATFKPMKDTGGNVHQHH